ncbi:hypothetical protein [Hymenobacter tenuis]
METTVTIGKKSQVVFQIGGTNNTASATKVNNAGRAASAGANGGSSQPTTTNKIPLWAIILVALLGAGIGAWGWQKLKARPG